MPATRSGRDRRAVCELDFPVWTNDLPAVAPAAQCSLLVDGDKDLRAILACRSVLRNPRSALSAWSQVNLFYPYGSIRSRWPRRNPGITSSLERAIAGQTDNPLLYAVTNAAPTISARFVQLGQNQLTLTVSSNGPGT